MPIGPKYRLGEQYPEVSRPFTDREEFIRVFEQAVSELPPKEYEVLVYYGMGGIGKTRLRKELVRLLEEKHPQTVRAVLDFRNTTYRDAQTALSSLVQELKKKYGVQFPSFDLASAILWQKSNPQTSYRQDPTPLETLLEQGTLFANLVSLVEEVPIVSWVPKFSKVISKSDRLFREWWTKRGHQDLDKLHEKEPADIVEWLPAFWASDLKDHLERESRPAVLFMDTYEALWEGEGRRAEGRFLAQDEWVRELVSQLPEVLWVITGQQRLRWDEKDEDWRNYQHQHLVGGLSEEDARRFLASCEVNEETIQEVIVEGGKGVPYYLNLAVDTYEQIETTLQRDPAPSDFRGTPGDVLDRFLRYLERSETETLKVLYVARFWDRELFESLIEEFNTGYPATALPEMCRFSFVQAEQRPNTWTIHPLMRQALEEHLDDELHRRVHKYLFDYYADSLEGLESTAIGDVHKMALTEAFHHGRDALPVQEFFEWFIIAGDIFRRAALWQFLIPLYEELTSLMEVELGIEHPDTVNSINNLAMLYLEQGRYKEAEPLLRKALEMREAISGTEHPATAKMVNNLAALYQKLGRYKEAEPLLRKALEIREAVLAPEHLDTAISFNDLATLYQSQGRYGEAASYFRRALTIRAKVLGIEHPDTANSINNLAVLHQKLKRYKEAEPLLRKALEIREAVLGPEHPYTAISINNLAILYEKLGRYKEAEPLLRKALEIRKRVLGIEHPDTALSSIKLAANYVAQGRYEEAKELKGLWRNRN